MFFLSIHVKNVVWEVTEQSQFQISDNKELSVHEFVE